MKTINFRLLKFSKTLATIPDLEKWSKGHPHHPQFAFIGKSNVGKSSLINHLGQNKTLAKVSSTPGKTQVINVFDLNECCVIDLPGYGFAKVSKEIKSKWNELIAAYLELCHKTLSIFILIDPKKPVSEDDFFMMNICNELGVPFIIIFTKIDQIPKTHLEGTIRPRLAEIKSYLKAEPAFLLYSTKSSVGKDALTKLFIEQLSNKV